MKFAAWVPPEKRSQAWTDSGLFWVKDNQSNYVAEKERCAWNTRKMAEQAIVEDWEEVIEIEDET